MAYIVYAGAAKRTARRAALAGAVVAGESLIFTVNRRDRTSCAVATDRQLTVEAVHNDASLCHP